MDDDLSLGDYEDVSAQDLSAYDEVASDTPQDNWGGSDHAPEISEGEMAAILQMLQGGGEPSTTRSDNGVGALSTLMATILGQQGEPNQATLDFNPSTGQRELSEAVIRQGIPSAAKGEADSLQKIANMPYEQTLRMASDPDPRTLFKEQSAIGKLVSGDWSKLGGLDWLKILAPALGFGANYMGAQSANKDAQKAANAQNANVQGALSNFKEQMGRSTKIPGRGYMATTANRNAINIG